MLNTSVFFILFVAKTSALLIMLSCSLWAKSDNSNEISNLGSNDFLDDIPLRIKDLLSKEKFLDEKVFQFYKNRDFSPIWINNKNQIEQLNLQISNIEIHALPASRYKSKYLEPFRNDDLSESQKAILELEITKTFLKLSTDLLFGVIKPQTVSTSINIDPLKYKNPNILKDYHSMGNVSSYIESITPKDTDYLNLQQEYKKLKEIKKNQTWSSKVPVDVTLIDTMNHPNVKLLRTRLFSMGYLQSDNGSEEFGADLLTGLKKFQSHYGLNDDGVAGNNTLQSINVEPETRLAQVAVNLERIRWLNFDKGSTFILVNQPNFRAIYKNNGRIIWDSRVVIGLPDFQTAEFIDEMTHIIVNPTWHVPKSIAVDEYLPLIQENPNFIIENNMRLMIRGTDKAIDPSLIDMSLFTVDNFPFEIKQNPSNINALGLVKFMFPNKFSIYMHDTPMKDLFSKDLRAFSHGCVRVQTPFEFANALLSGEKEVEVEKFSKALSSNIETQINLVNGIPVYLTYRTVFFTDEGIPQYRPDIYGRDALLYLELFKAGLPLEIRT